MKLIDVRVEQLALGTDETSAFWRLIKDDRVFNVDWDPPASGPESEITFRNLTEEEAQNICAELGLTVLAIRERTIRETADDTPGIS